jgi:hypothetical protein
VAVVVAYVASARIGPAPAQPAVQAASKPAQTGS